ncbi:TetR family transcriptional regulator [Pueribacillus theae]|uniref:TetR family transcriptional regulator n=1 Tax=Pueribacillus theae TaxID=2171751 RepID=A0A2U1JT80_9BACI|nr:TetR/AcrR family transcriptional regulator [Pueribacillus theae]PWA08149.1 TetR family transcriptional regulator [Pueribacillus theae]
MEKSNDLRVIRTKQLIRDALLTLIKEVGLENITVKKLTECAQINRSTFYAHFYDKYDLLESTINDELLSFVEEAAPKSEEELIATHYPKAFYLRAAQYIYQRADFFKIMMGENGIPSFQQQLLQIMKKYMAERLEKFHPQLDKMEIPKEFFISYVAHANIGVISYWLESGMQYSPQYVAEKMSNMTVEGPLSVAGIK